ncbi:hypothetical protein BT63DRAFT_411075 [Microthyrium microscopicum]|uniref:Ecp2 effector protein domain-containing protein n=1 Tax=Microthyrium microscopicum TaxID=703497 RepID=A0A6A6UIU8_9PEZI|nr:hypothetical protein BT63DRAFT_411075 [Microthyrium microscopicum]
MKPITLLPFLALLSDSATAQNPKANATLPARMKYRNTRQRGYTHVCNRENLNYDDRIDLHKCIQRLSNMPDHKQCNVQDRKTSHFCEEGRIKISGRTWYGEDGRVYGTSVAVPCKEVGVVLKKLFQTCGHGGGSMGVVKDNWPGTVQIWDLVVHFGTKWV